MTIQTGDAKPKDYNFAPRLADGSRIYLRLSATDLAKTRERRLGRWGIVTDLTTGKRYTLKGASCGLAGCNCDAIANDYPDRADSAKAMA